MRLAGVDVRLHAGALPFQAVVAYATSGGDLDAALARFGALATILVAVLVHELSHGIAARARGLAVFDVRIHALGGVARIERPPAPTWRPRDEWGPAVAGPAGNLLVGGLAFAAMLALGRDPVGAIRARRWTEDPLPAFVVGNLVLGAANLVPAFPSDGGRVLRALLAARTGYLRATRVALVVGTVVVAAVATAMIDAIGARAVLPVGLLAVLLGFYAVEEHRAAVLWDQYDRFCRFVAQHEARLPALRALPRDARGLPVPTPEILSDPEVAAALAGRGTAVDRRRPGS